MTAAVETLAREFATRPTADRGAAVVMLVTQIDSEVRKNFPHLTEGQRGNAVLRIANNVITRAIEIDQENDRRPAVQRALL